MTIYLRLGELIRTPCPTSTRRWTRTRTTTCPTTSAPPSTWPSPAPGPRSPTSTRFLSSNQTFSRYSTKVYILSYAILKFAELRYLHQKSPDPDQDQNGKLIRIRIRNPKHCLFNFNFLVSFPMVCSSVPDPKLIIPDPDPQIENQEFWIRINL